MGKLKSRNREKLNCNETLSLKGSLIYTTDLMFSAFQLHHYTLWYTLASRITLFTFDACNEMEIILTFDII